MASAGMAPSSSSVHTVVAVEQYGHYTLITTKLNNGIREFPVEIKYYDSHVRYARNVQEAKRWLDYNGL